MKKTFSLVFIIMLFVVLGCSLGSKTTEKIDTPDPATEKIDTPDPATGSTPEAKETTKSTSSDGLTMDKFNEIKTGMDYDEVVKIIGSEGTETRSSEIGKIKIASYKWEGEKYQRVYATFRDGKLTSKTQSGLSGGSTTGATADISMDKYEQIKNGMTYEEVVKIIGSEGEEANSSTIGGTERKSYRWKGEKSSSIRVSFKNDKMTSKSQGGLKK